MPAKAGSGTTKLKRLQPKVAEVTVYGLSPYVQNRFSARAREQMRLKQEAGTRAVKSKDRSPKDFQSCFEMASYKSKEGWYGIPAVAFRHAMIDACRLVNFKMTHAKQAILRIIPDGYEREDGTPLVKIRSGNPIFSESVVRNENGVADIRARPAFPPGWEAIVRVEYDPDIFTEEEIRILLDRAGRQVGIGEGRPFSSNSHGMGWGTFAIKD